MLITYTAAGSVRQGRGTSHPPDSGPVAAVSSTPPPLRKGPFPRLPLGYLDFTEACSAPTRSVHSNEQATSMPL